jgi:hypothetical protein
MWWTGLGLLIVIKNAITETITLFESFPETLHIYTQDGFPGIDF